MRTTLKTLVTAFTLGLLLTLAAPAFAQPAGSAEKPTVPKALQRLDRDLLIAKLRDFGMNDLLQHLAQVEIDDPVDAARLEIDVLIVKANNTGIPMPERVAAARDSIEKLKALIEANRDHIKRAIWQTELGENILFLYLTQLQNGAVEFYCYGVPSKDQHRAIEGYTLNVEGQDQQTVINGYAYDAYLHLADATQTLFKMAGEIPGDAKKHAELQATGEWDRWMKEYREGRTRFTLAAAAHLLAHLPDSHTYYRELTRNPNPRFGRVARSIPAERERLFLQAVDELGRMDESIVRKFGLAEPAKLTAGLCMIGANKFDQGMKELNAAKVDGLARVTSYLGLARAMALKGTHDDAVEFLDDRASKPPVNQNLIFRVLMTDGKHRVLIHKAAAIKDKAERQAAEAAAFNPYNELFEDPVLGDNADAIRGFVYRRWADTTTGDARRTAPAMVQMAIGETLRMDGQNLVAAAMDFDSKNQQANAQEKRDAAGKVLKESIAVLDALLARPAPEAANPDEPTEAEKVVIASYNEIAARAIYNKAFATYLHNPTNPGIVLKTVELFTEVPAKYPEVPLAETAMEIALNLVRPLADPADEQIQADVKVPAQRQYIKTARVLFDKFPSSGMATGERTFFAFNILQAKRRWEEAAQIYEMVPPGHPHYLTAQSERIFCLQQLFKNTLNPAERKRFGKLIIDATNNDPQRDDDLVDLIQQERQNWDNLPAKRQTELRQAEATMSLARAEVEIGENNFGFALNRLGDFQKKYSEPAFKDMSRDAYSLQIKATIGLNNPDQAVQLARDMMAGYPDAAAAVIDDQLRYLDLRIAKKQNEIMMASSNTLRSRLRAERDKLAGAAVPLADLLMTWAKGQEGMTKKELIGFVRIQAKALAMSGKSDEAVSKIDPLLEEHPRDAGLRFARAEAYYFKGDEDALIQARDGFYKLIESMNENVNHYLNDPALNELWWQTWMRSLQTVDALYELNKQNNDNPYEASAKRIPESVRVLHHEDDSLGGDPYASELRSLQRKYLKMQ